MSAQQQPLDAPGDLDMDISDDDGPGDEPPPQRQRGAPSTGAAASATTEMAPPPSPSPGVPSAPEDERMDVSGAPQQERQPSEGQSYQEPIPPTPPPQLMGSPAQLTTPPPTQTRSLPPPVQYQRRCVGTGGGTIIEFINTGSHIRYGEFGVKGEAQAIGCSRSFHLFPTWRSISRTTISANGRASSSGRRQRRRRARSHAQLMLEVKGLPFGWEFDGNDAKLNDIYAE
eukprot:5591633-Pyramimonas_sp.AAC.1